MNDPALDPRVVLDGMASRGWFKSLGSCVIRLRGLGHWTPTERRHEQTEVVTALDDDDDDHFGGCPGPTEVETLQTTRPGAAAIASHIEQF